LIERIQINIVTHGNHRFKLIVPHEVSVHHTLSPAFAWTVQSSGFEVTSTFSSPANTPRRHANSSNSRVTVLIMVAGDTSQK
jgi:hypothetical protein